VIAIDLERTSYKTDVDLRYGLLENTSEHKELVQHAISQLARRMHDATCQIDNYSMNIIDLC
jgi:hypothetical protein